MMKKYLGVGLAALLLAISFSRPAVAQSGRGRQLRIAERLNGYTGKSVQPADELLSAGNPGESKSSPSANIAKGRNARLIYRDDSEHHPNRADKKAGWILLGLFALEMGVLIANDGDFWKSR